MAADKGGQFAVRGPGALSCQALLDLKDADRPTFYQQLEDWTVGYVTAVNRTVPNTYDALVVQQPVVVPNMIAAVCKANPKAPIESVVYGILQRLQPARLEHESPLVVAKAGKLAVPVRKETLAEMQHRLITLKLYKGQANGEFGPETEAALRQYQKSASLQETGLPDAATVIRMLVEQPVSAPNHGKGKSK